VLCDDEDGDSARASFTYYKGYLAAPTNFTVTPGDAVVTAGWETIDSADVDHYLLYFDSESFGVADSPTACNADISFCSPVVVPQPGDDSGDDDSAGDDDDSAIPIGPPHSVLIDQLENGQPWYFAVAAVDADGNVGPRTDVLSATPSVTGGAAALAGDSGGCTCESSLVPGGSDILPALLLVLFALAPLHRRRRPTTKQE
jgi:MYXO-CTERM domain-containing protein